MSVIQLIQLTSEQLQELISAGIKPHIDELKKEMQPKVPTEYLTRNEVADYFKVDISTVHNWTKKGKIKSYGIAGRVYYKRQEIEQSLIELN